MRKFDPPLLDPTGLRGPVTVVSFVRLAPDGVAALGRFRPVFVKILDEVGAEVVCRVPVAQTSQGIVGVFRYPDAEAVRAVFQSGAYRRLDGLRRRAFDEIRLSLVVNSNAPPAGR